MDLQDSVFLLFVLFAAGHSLSCYQCEDPFGSCANQTEKTCPSGFSKCESVTFVRKVGTASLTIEGKDCSVDCANGSIDFGITQMSYVCCNSDQCNKEDAPDPSTGTPNGKKCYYCNENNCFNILSCSGNKDHCITATAAYISQSMIVKGCASKSICDAETVTGFPNITCCQGYLCNGAKSVTQSFLLLCFPLISFILML